MSRIGGCNAVLCAAAWLAVSIAPSAHAGGQRDFDFNLGAWKTHVSRLAKPLSGSTRRLEYDGLSVVSEVWNGRANLIEVDASGPAGHIQGMGLRLYNPQSRQWSLNWASSADGTLDEPMIGEFKHGHGDFFDHELFGGRSILVRNSFTDITAQSSRFEQAFSADGGRSWEPNWLMTFERTERPAVAATMAGADAAHDFTHDFDFDFGTWTLRASRLQQPLTGSTTWEALEGKVVVRRIWGGRANLAEVTARGQSGAVELLSLRLYNPQTRQWTMHFAQSEHGTLGPPLVGEFKDGRGEFYGQDTLANGRAVLVREIYAPIDANSRSMEVAYSDDGGRTWETNWKMVDTKILPLAPAIADPARPASDRALDAGRRPAESLAFAGVKPGVTVVDLMPGAGYWTRILSKVVGPQGKVYALQPAEMDKAAPQGTQSVKSFAGTAEYPNVTLLLQPIANLSPPQHLDLIWTSMNYHDLHDPFMGSPDMKRLSATLLGALKPGGTLLVLDHAAAAGSGFTKTDDLHRVEPAAVKAELTAAGFEFVEESDALRNPQDDHTQSVFKAEIRGKTDRFLYKFRKP